jgi:CBS-domain-containing membrane protein
MLQNPNVAETLSSPEVAVLPTDTLLSALRVMERHGVRLLPVMAKAGRMVGLISQAHILAAWKLGPLMPVAMVMAACGVPRG